MRFIIVRFTFGTLEVYAHVLSLLAHSLQKNAGSVSIHHLGKGDAAVNRMIFGFTLVGFGCVLFSLGSMALGVNKVKKN